VTDSQDLVTLLLERSVRQGDFVLASGARSSYYIDARLTTMSAHGLSVVGRLGLQAIQDAGWAPQAVGGLTMGADPVAYAIARASDDQPMPINAFSVRKAAKQHGTGKRIEGNFQPGASVVVVEDVITSGGSAKEAIDAIVQEGGLVLGVLAVVDREEGGRAMLRQLGHKVVVLTTVSQMGLRK
jgi:orotate phosphoribosyltransferase